MNVENEKDIIEEIVEIEIPQPEIRKNKLRVEDILEKLGKLSENVNLIIVVCSFVMESIKLNFYNAWLTA